MSIFDTIKFNYKVTSFCSLKDMLASLGIGTGKFFSEVLILASTNPQYDKRLSIELPVHYMKIPSLEHGEKIRRR